MSVRRSLFVLLLAIIVVPVAANLNAANQAAQAQAAQMAQLQNLQTHTVARGNVEAVVTTTGTIEAEAMVDVSFDSGGRVAEVFAQEGDYVQAGDPLIRLENSAEQIAYYQASLRLQKAQFNLEDLQGPVDENDIRIAQANLETAQANYQETLVTASPDDIHAAELEYQQAVEALQGAERARQVAGGLSEAEFTALDAQIGEASFNAEIARLRLQDLQHGNGGNQASAAAAVETAQRELEQVLAGTDPNEIEQARVSLNQAQAELNQAEKDYNDTVLVAPRAGIISELSVVVGDLVTANQAVVTLADVSRLHVTIPIDETDVQAIDVDMPARISIDALPDVEFPAQVASLSLVGDDNEGVVTYDADITLNQQDERVLVGMTADAGIVVASRENVLVVPSEYIRVSGDSAFVGVMQPNGSTREVEISLGLQGEENTEVTSGIQEGDVIAVDLSGETTEFTFGGPPPGGRPGGGGPGGGG